MAETSRLPITSNTDGGAAVLVRTPDADYICGVMHAEAESLVPLIRLPIGKNPSIERGCRQYVERKEQYAMDRMPVDWSRTLPLVRDYLAT